MRQRSIENVDKLDARFYPRDFNLLRNSPEFLMDQNKFYHFFHKLLYKKKWFLIAVRQKVKSIDNSVAVHELELVLNITRL